MPHSYPHLLEPITVGRTTLRNRSLMGSMHVGLEEQPDGFERMAAFYAERAKGGEDPGDRVEHRVDGRRRRDHGREDDEGHEVADGLDGTLPAGLPGQPGAEEDREHEEAAQRPADDAQRQTGQRGEPQGHEHEAGGAEHVAGGVRLIGGHDQHPCPASGSAHRGGRGGSGFEHAHRPYPSINADGAAAWLRGRH